MNIVVLGMHRSGTSCIGAMLAAAGAASAGDAIRNWDNARGHHEMLALVRLDEAVLAHSGGHWLTAPAEVRWTAAHAAERDRLLRLSIGGTPALLKDPRTLLIQPFWRASTIPFRAIGVVRHPLAVARSLEAWRGMPLSEGIALWLAHNRVLAADHAHHRYPVIDFEQPKAVVVAALAAEFGADPSALAAAYDEQLVHHDVADPPSVVGLDEALSLYRRFGIHGGERRTFPRPSIAAFNARLATGDRGAAVVSAREALTAIADAAAVLIPIVTALIRDRAYSDAAALIAEHADRLEAGLADLLHGKVALAAGDAATAVRHLEIACAIPEPLFQARQLLPQALRAAGRSADARAALAQLSRDALYPHGPLSTLAEWSWLDGDRERAFAEMRNSIVAAPSHRRGRLRTRLAEWLRMAGDLAAARAELELAIEEDPGYTRSRDLLASL